MSANLDDIQSSLQAAYRDGIEKQLREESAVLKTLARDRRRGHSEPPTDEQLAAYRDFERRWDAIHAEGEAAGFLVDDYDGPRLAEEPRGDWVWDETEEEHRQRLQREQCDIGSGGHVVFPVAKGPRP